MDSLKELFKIGNGPSSSHTMGPERAARRFKGETPNAKSYKVELYGSLALTGKGHLTDWIIEKTLEPVKTEIVWKPEVVHPFHTNGMKFFAYDEAGNEIKNWLVFSVGGGTIVEEGQGRYSTSTVYPLKKMDDIIEWCKENKKELWEYVTEHEDADIEEFLTEIWKAMEEAVERGIAKDGVLPGSIGLKRRAQTFYRRSRSEGKVRQFRGKLFAYTLAVSEENAGGGRVVTAPTCGAAGVVPGTLYTLKEAFKLEPKEIVKALAVAGLIGNIVKENASISGAEAGCQAEVGTACAMAAGMAAFLMGGTIEQIEYAAEMALEHNLGLTCDPIGGYVQIPCIERNASAAAKALDTANYALYTDGQHSVSFDEVVITMGETGRDMKEEYRETSLGGLAKHFCANC
ncbi:L-serine ammonia-lyase [Fusobacterium sp.]|uniref:L-serine ammonia-lyase n=1 Tax=Fusobacterium sp. TaxID=68766 RepID=UPI00263705C6|nr:L-serine ammonia-lyase [Fusobacterium sp.]